MTQSTYFQTYFKNPFAGPGLGLQEWAGVGGGPDCGGLGRVRGPCGGGAVRRILHQQQAVRQGRAAAHHRETGG